MSVSQDFGSPGSIDHKLVELSNLLKKTTNVKMQNNHSKYMSLVLDRVTTNRNSKIN